MSSLKFLPIHPAMNLPIGTTVMNVGVSSRRGWVGKVVPNTTGSKHTHVLYGSGADIIIQPYAPSSMINQMYVCVCCIANMERDFNGEGYLNKYYETNAITSKQDSESVGYITNHANMKERMDKFLAAEEKQEAEKAQAVAEFTDLLKTLAHRQDNQHLSTTHYELRNGRGAVLAIGSDLNSLVQRAKPILEKDPTADLDVVKVSHAHLGALKFTPASLQLV